MSPTRYQRSSIELSQWMWLNQRHRSYSGSQEALHRIATRTQTTKAWEQAYAVKVIDIVLRQQPQAVQLQNVLLVSHIRSQNSGVIKKDAQLASQKGTSPPRLKFRYLCLTKGAMASRWLPDTSILTYHSPGLIASICSQSLPSTAT